MKHIFVNLKRFDVPRRLGGVCPADDPVAWIESVMDGAVGLGLGGRPDLSLVFLLPEGLAPAAVRRLAGQPSERSRMIAIGSQGVHWDDVRPGGNFGAFTTATPASAATNLGSRWAIIGHSEERRFKLQVISAFEPGLAANPAALARAAAAIDSLVNGEVRCALAAGLRVLLCVGESAEERGDGPFEQQRPRIEEVLRRQVSAGLAGLREQVGGGRVVIGYEPIWAIGPGKTPPGREYIAFVSANIKQVVREQFAVEDVAVVYGGGLKEENAAMIAGIATIDGGLVALTRFVGQIGFDVQELASIVDKYC